MGNIFIYGVTLHETGVRCLDSFVSVTDHSYNPIEYLFWYCLKSDSLALALNLILVTEAEVWRLRHVLKWIYLGEESMKNLCGIYDVKIWN